jgi:hypothetical protein
MTTETGGPAFPVFHQNEITGYVPPESAGMTLRDYFASKAMEGILASNTEHEHEDAHIFDAIAEASYKQADAMLKARRA